MAQLVIAIPLPEEVNKRAFSLFGASPTKELLAPMQAMALAKENQATALVVSAQKRYTAEIIAQAPACLKLICTTSAGYDHIDIDAASAAGIGVTHTPGAPSKATADLTMMLILASCRRLKDYISVMEEGWRRRFNLDEMLGLDVSGRRLGIVGMGKIGQELAKRARGFDMPITYHNRNRLPAEQEQGAQYCATLKELLSDADIVSLLLPSNNGHPLMTAERFAQMRRGSVFINTARGDLVDENALIDALQSGHLAAAAADVMRNEPEYDLRLRSAPNLLLTPHMGSATHETRAQMGFRVLENIEMFLAGNRPRNLLNAPAWAEML